MSKSRNCPNTVKPISTSTILLGGLRLGRIAWDLLTVHESAERQGMLGAAESATPDLNSSNNTAAIGAP